MSKNKITVTNKNDDKLFNDVQNIIENRKRIITQHANNNGVIMFWEVGQRVNKDILKNERAEYGKRIVPTLSAEMTKKYGNGFSERNIWKMIDFAKQFPQLEIVANISPYVSWSHIVELLPYPMDAKVYYFNEIHNGLLGVRDLRQLISRKSYERREIANTQIGENSAVPFNAFKDPYLLDALGLHDTFLEADLERAILHKIENVMLELGYGFNLTARQKRMSVGTKDYHLDLLFYNRELKRLVAVELKLGEFKISYKAQMEFYLKWLNENERKQGEEAPIGIILCTKADRAVVEFLELDKSGIVIAEYWTKLPPKKEFEKKINAILAEAQERLERRKQLGTGKVQKQIEYFAEPDEDI